MSEHNETPRILIIDNDEGVVRALSTRLSSIGYECATAMSGSQGLSMFQQQPADLVISDLNMPAGDGVALASSLRKHSNVPIIFVTGFQEEYRRRLRNIANVTVFRKPFDMGDLLDIIEAELALHGAVTP